MADLGAQRQSIAAALQTVPELAARVHSEGLWPTRTNLPAAAVWPADDNGPLNLDLSNWYEHFEVVVAVSLAGGQERAQRGLDSFHDEVMAALVVDLADTLLSVRRQSYGRIEIDAVDYLGFVLRLEMIG